MYSKKKLFYILLNRMQIEFHIDYLHFESFSFKELNSPLRTSILMAWSLTIWCKTLSSFIKISFSFGPEQVSGTGFSVCPLNKSKKIITRKKVQNSLSFPVAILLSNTNTRTGAAQKMIEDQVHWVTLTKLKYKCMNIRCCVNVYACHSLSVCTYCLTPSRILFI